MSGSVLAMIMAGGPGKGLSVLTARRAAASVPFGGKYRVIDFTLSNCVNSNIYNVGVLTQYWPRGLNDHIGVGKPWDLDRLHGGVHLLQPYLGVENTSWQRGTADAVIQNLDFIQEQHPDYVLLLAGDHIYKMDYRPLIHFHLEKSADVTLAVRTVPKYETYRFGIVRVDPDGEVVEFQEKPRWAYSTLASMGIYVFNTDFLIDRLMAQREKSPGLDFGRDIIPAMVSRDKVYAYHFMGYWADVGTVQSYWEANQALLATPPALDLHDPEWVIHTKSEERPAVYIGEDAQVADSLLSDGTRVEGTVERSVLSPGVYIAPGAIVKDAIVLNDARIGAGAIVEHVILDKRVVVGDGAVVGFGKPDVPNMEEPEIVNIGLVLVGKDAGIPSGIRVGRNAVIHPDVTPDDFQRFEGEIPAGTTVRPL